MKSQTKTHEEQHNEAEQFLSVSGNSSDIEQDVKQVQLSHAKNYSLKPINFPELDPKTIRLYSMYQQNNTLISNLKQQIVRLQRIKKQSVYLQQQLVTTAVQQTLISEYFMTCQETYEKRQLQLLRLKKDLKTIDTEQVRILMARNPNILNLAQTYFEEFKTIIDAKTYEDGLVLLTEEKKRNKKRKQPNIEDLVSDISLDQSQANTRTSSLRPKKQQLSALKPKKQQKPRQKYMIRFIHYSQIFSQLSNANSPLIQKFHYIIPLSLDQVPISLTYCHKLNLILILLKSGQICAFTLTENDSALSFHDNKSSHKTQHMYSKLCEIPGVRIEFDSRVKVVNWEIREDKMFVLTSDSLLRVYEIVLKGQKVERLKIANIIYCQNRQKQVGQIVGMAFSALNPQDLLFITDKSHLCKFSMCKLKSQVLYIYNQKLESINPFYLQASDKLFFSTQNFDPIQTKLIDKYKLITTTELDNQLHKQLKILCLLRNQKVYLIRVEIHGLLTGVELDLEAMSPQVEIIETIIEQQ